ncbi:cytochrome P450 [Phlebopus sp. FC_14]|nr:cytochrome P450 [Phlebopus sp. FC_14]
MGFPPADNHTGIFCLALALACVVLFALFTSAGRRLPPGPRKGFFGTMKVPQTYQWLAYAKWMKIYGDIIYIRVLGNPVMVINSAKAAEELLERRSRNYSSRMGWDWLFSTMPYGPRWRDHRSLFHRHFRRSLTSTHHPTMLKETRTTLRNFLDKPEDFAHHLRRTAAAIVMKMSYGHEVADEGDFFVTLADEALQGLGKAGIFGTFFVDYLPILKYIPDFMPGAGFKRQARIWRQATRAMIDKPFQMVLDRMANGTAVPCFAQKELEIWMQTSDRDPRYEALIKNVAGISYAAGADTSVSTLLSFILAMVIHPEVQRKAQQHLDDVTKKERLPSFADKYELPFIDCIVWECLRWNPVTPMGVAHYVSEDDEYSGYFIPKGTSVLPNVWAILHDEMCYPEPMMCPGRWLAFDSIWIAIASILSVYTIEKAITESGEEIMPKVEYTSSMISRPKPFKCRIVPRSEKARILIAQTRHDDTVAKTLP